MHSCSHAHIKKHTRKRGLTDTQTPVFLYFPARAESKNDCLPYRLFFAGPFITPALITPIFKKKIHCSSLFSQVFYIQFRPLLTPVKKNSAVLGPAEKDR